MFQCDVKSTTACKDCNSREHVTVAVMIVTGVFSVIVSIVILISVC